MRHNHVIEGIKYKLRPVGLNDVGFILKLRCDPALNKYLHSTSSSQNDQINWMNKYFDRFGDYYFVVEGIRNQNPVGLVALYDIDDTGKNGEWGRWIISKGSFASIESCWLIYRFAFERLNQKKICCRTVELNQPVVSFHDSCGITTKKLLVNYFTINERKINAIEHSLTNNEWKLIEPNLKNIATKLANKFSNKIVE